MDDDFEGVEDDETRRVLIALADLIEGVQNGKYSVTWTGDVVLTDAQFNSATVQLNGTFKVERGE